MANISREPVSLGTKHSSFDYNNLVDLHSCLENSLEAKHCSDCDENLVI